MVGAQHAPQRAGRVALHGEHRMDQQLHADSRVAEHDAERVDQERHVVGDDRDQRAAGLEAMACRIRVEDGHQGLAAAAAATHGAVGERDGGERPGRTGCEVVLADAAEVLAPMKSRAAPARPADAGGPPAARARRALAIRSSRRLGDGD